LAFSLLALPLYFNRENKPEPKMALVVVYRDETNTSMDIITLAGLKGYRPANSNFFFPFRQPGSQLLLSSLRNFCDVRIQVDGSSDFWWSHVLPDQLYINEGDNEDLQVELIDLYERERLLTPSVRTSGEILSDAVAGIASLSVSANSRVENGEPINALTVHMSLHFLRLFSKLLKQMVSASIQFDQVSYNKYINMASNIIESYSDKTFGARKRTQVIVDHEKEILDLFVAVLAQENHPLWLSFDHTLKELIKTKIDDAIREAWANDRLGNSAEECVTTTNYFEDQSIDSCVGLEPPPIPPAIPAEVDWEEQKEEF